MQVKAAKMVARRRAGTITAKRWRRAKRIAKAPWSETDMMAGAAGTLAHHREHPSGARTTGGPTISRPRLPAVFFVRALPDLQFRACGIRPARGANFPELRPSARNTDSRRRQGSLDPTARSLRSGAHESHPTRRAPVRTGRLPWQRHGSPRGPEKPIRHFSG